MKYPSRRSSNRQRWLAAHPFIRSAVEGIKLSSDMKKRAQEFDRRGLSAEERREAIISKHRKD